MKLEGGERLVLKSVADLQGSSTDYVDDSRLAVATKIRVEDVRDWLEALEGKGFVERTRLTDGFSAYVTAKGKQALRSTEPIPSPKPPRDGAPVTPDAPGGTGTASRDELEEHLALLKRQNEYQPAPWEKICVVTAALLVVVLVGFLVVRNKPFNDPNLVVLISNCAQHRRCRPRGFDTRIPVCRPFYPWSAHSSRGALSVFVLTFFFSPNVLPGPVISPPVSSVNDEPQKPSRDGESNAPKISQPPNSPTLNSSILAGYIIDAETREPLAGVTLTIQDWETIDGQSPTATTDAAGRFRFDNLRPSADVSQQVRLIARKPGYRAGTTDTTLGLTALPIKLRPTTTSEAKR